ncbi:hypothetical protein FQR65_LT08711 [Abscondita terminalis]|nr:hypothetical protein FQR65_LT08711 [Abscondita terminalis]
MAAASSFIGAKVSGFLVHDVTRVILCSKEELTVPYIIATAYSAVSSAIMVAVYGYHIIVYKSNHIIMSYAFNIKFCCGLLCVAISFDLCACVAAYHHREELKNDSAKNEVPFNRYAYRRFGSQDSSEDHANINRLFGGVGTMRRGYPLTHTNKQSDTNKDYENTEQLSYEKNFEEDKDDRVYYVIEKKIIRSEENVVETIRKLKYPINTYLPDHSSNSHSEDLIHLIR